MGSGDSGGPAGGAGRARCHYLMTIPRTTAENQEVGKGKGRDAEEEEGKAEGEDKGEEGRKVRWRRRKGGKT